MVNLLTRHAVAVLLAAEHTQADVAARLGLSERTVRRIAAEGPVTHVDDAAERKKRKVGRPSAVASFEPFVVEVLAEEPRLPTLEILRRARDRGYTGGKSALYELVARHRPPEDRLKMRFEGVPGEFSQHDFGEVVVRYRDGSTERIVFFASRLKYSRTVAVTIVANQTAETLVRTLLDHFVLFGGVPLLAVFDRPRTVALARGKDGVITEWNPVFAHAALEIGFCAEVCWAYSPEQKGAVEALVKWVKGSFFKVRRFDDKADLLAQLTAWHDEVNTQRESRATGVIPATLLAEERPRLRAPRVQPDAFALRLAASVGPTAYVLHDTHPYSMPPEAAGLPATLYLYKDRVRIVAGRFEATHPRKFERGAISTLPEHRAAQLAAVAGQRGRRYLKRQHLFELGADAVAFLTEIVHKNPTGWWAEVEILHGLLQRHGPDVLRRAFKAAVGVGRCDLAYVQTVLGQTPATQLPLIH